MARDIPDARGDEDGRGYVHAEGDGDACSSPPFNLQGEDAVACSGSGDIGRALKPDETLIVERRKSNWLTARLDAKVTIVRKAGSIVIHRSFSHTMYTLQVCEGARYKNDR